MRGGRKNRGGGHPPSNQRDNNGNGNGNGHGNNQNNGNGNGNIYKGKTQQQQQHQQQQPQQHNHHQHHQHQHHQQHQQHQQQSSSGSAMITSGQSTGHGAANSPSSPLTKHQQQQLKVDLQVSEFHAIMEDMKTTSSAHNVANVGVISFGWKEVAILLITLLALGVASVVVGVAAGMTISIHYYYFPPVHRGDREGLVVNSQRVTNMDNDMVARNVLSVPSGSPDYHHHHHHHHHSHHSHHNHPNSGRSATGRERNAALSIVHEAAPLGSSSPFVSSYLRDVIYTESTIRPSLCSDGATMGYRDWQTLKAAVREANALSAETFLRWNEYFAGVGGDGVDADEFLGGAGAAVGDGGTPAVFQDDALYYEEDVVFTVCPGTLLKARRGPIFVNAENVILECPTADCVIEVGGTHLAFGPHAKNILVRGITFKGAQTSSLTFYYDGAEAVFEDCYWIGNAGTNKQGAVADVNSTSYVTFSRCEISDTRYSSGSGRRSHKEDDSFASSLTIRA